MQREMLFDCTLKSSRARYSALIPAWDAATAETLFRQVLAEDARTESGIIEVQSRGRVHRRSRFAPDDA